MYDVWFLAIPDMFASWVDTIWHRAYAKFLEVYDIMERCGVNYRNVLVDAWLRVSDVAKVSLLDRYVW